MAWIDGSVPFLESGDSTQRRSIGACLKGRAIGEAVWGVTLGDGNRLDGDHRASTDGSTAPPDREILDRRPR
jgi:hypothetical protein